MPDFEEFLASVDFEEAEKISKSICFGLPDLLQFDANDISSWGPALKATTENTLMRANTNTIALLKIYHQWLQDHLES